MSAAARPWVFGEVLFDCFPDGARVLGGAPFNVAWHLQAFGLEPVFVSRLGEDEPGAEILRAMGAWGMDVSGVQVDDALPTGRVRVSLRDGEPGYDIEHPVAYDAIAPPAERGPIGLLYHGSLALRSAAAREALRSLLASEPECVFVDVNLRAPWWDRGRVLDSLRAAHWVKLNAQELALLGEPGDDSAGRFVRSHGLNGLVLTQGASGAEVHLADGRVFRGRPQRAGAFKDAVGAGDAFAAVMICALVNDWPPELALDRALAFAARQCTRRGATVADPGHYAPLLRQWRLDED